MSTNNNSTSSNEQTDNHTPSLSFTYTPSHRTTDLHGLEETCDHARTIISALISDIDIKTQSVLIHGPSGNGKTRLAEAMAGDLFAGGFSVGWFDSFTDHLGQEYNLIRQAVQDALQAAPSVLVLDNLPDVQADTVFSSLREVLQRVSPDRQVLVVATGGPNMWGATAPTPFETHIAVGYPDEDRASKLLDSFITDYAAASSLDVTVDIESLGDTAAGLSAANIDRGTKRAFQKAVVTSSDTEATVTTESLQASLEAVATSLPRVATPWLPTPAPDTGESRIVEETNVTFADIGGLDDVKAELRAALEHPLRFPDVFKDCGLDADGVLLYGAPGNGKTMLAKALANEYDRTFITVNGPELQDKFVGATEQHIRQVFATARDCAPSVVFFDEFDALAGARDKVSSSHEVDFVTMLLAELDGFCDTSDVLVTAATNRPDSLDPGVLRPGRLGRHIHVPLPDDEAATAIVTTHTADFPLSEAVTPQWVVDELPDGISASAITEVCNQALRWHAMRRAAASDHAPIVTREDIRAAISDYAVSTEHGSDAGTFGFY